MLDCAPTFERVAMLPLLEKVLRCSLLGKGGLPARQYELQEQLDT